MSDIILISLVIWFFSYKQHLREILGNGLFDSLTTGKKKRKSLRHKDAKYIAVWDHLVKCIYSLSCCGIVVNFQN